MILAVTRTTPLNRDMPEHVYTATTPNSVAVRLAGLVPEKVDPFYRRVQAMGIGEVLHGIPEPDGTTYHVEREL